MKKMKRLAALFLAVVMVMAMGMTAMATELDPNPSVPTGEGTDDGYTLTVQNPAEGHKYEVYQIYTGKVSINDDGKAVLSDIVKGANISGTGTALAKDDVDALKKQIKESTSDEDFARELSKQISGKAFETLEKKGEETTASVTVPAGYYLVRDTWGGTGEENDGEKYSDFVLSIVGATTFAPKTMEVPTFDKSAETNLKVVSDKQVGDEVHFTLTATLPTDVIKYDEYKIAFIDTLSEGLTYKSNSIKVAVNGTEKTGLTVPEFNGQNLNYTIADIYKESGLGITKENAAGAVITVTYTATINSDAIKKNEGTTNTAHLEYTNGPDGSQDGSSTPSTVTVLLANLTINKTDEGKKPLPGAGFTLYKLVDGKRVEFAKIEPEGEDKNNWPTTFTFNGLAEGNYVLVESKTPDGFNTMKDIEITVEFESGKVGEKEVITKLTVTSKGEDAPTWVPNEGAIKTTASAEIVNYTGVELPSTGGIGTTIFYVVGGILVLGAGVLLITKKRMSEK